jgi:molybdopterin adenylyltransferase
LRPPLIVSFFDIFAPCLEAIFRIPFKGYYDTQTIPSAGRIAAVKAIVITISDSCFQGLRVDRSGPAVVIRLQQAGFSVEENTVVPDDVTLIAAQIRKQAGVAQLVVTTGGTGIALRDVTPEATRQVCDRILDGFGEHMRREGLKETPFAPMSRAVSGTLGATLVVNVPGNPRAALTSLEAVLPLIQHALVLLSGDTEHLLEPDNASENK